MTRRDIEGPDLKRADTGDPRRGASDEDTGCGLRTRRLADPRRRRRVLARLDALLAKQR